MKKIITIIDNSAMKALEWATTTKGAFWLLVVLIVSAQIVNPPQGLQAWLLVIVSEFYQGVALPGLGASQKAEAEETRRLLQETHDAIMGVLDDIKDTHSAELEEIQTLKEVIALLKSKGE